MLQYSTFVVWSDESHADCMLQGQLWAMCDQQALQTTNQPEAAIDARPLKRARAYHDSACISANGSSNNVQHS